MRVVCVRVWMHACSVHVCCACVRAYVLAWVGACVCIVCACVCVRTHVLYSSLVRTYVCTVAQ